MVRANDCHFLGEGRGRAQHSSAAAVAEVGAKTPLSHAGFESSSCFLGDYPDPLISGDKEAGLS